MGQALGAYLKVLVKTCGEALNMEGKLEETTEKWGLYKWTVKAFKTSKQKWKEGSFVILVYICSLQSRELLPFLHS